MDSAQNRDEKRNSERYRVPREDQPAELRVGQVRVPVSLLDESNDGFAALTASDLGLDHGSVVELHTRSGDYDVQVAYVGEMGTMATWDSGESQHLYRLGLQRLRDIPRDVEPETNLIARLIAPARSRSFTGLTILAILALAGAVAAMAMSRM